MRKNKKARIFIYTAIGVLVAVVLFLLFNENLINNIKEKYAATKGATDYLNEMQTVYIDGTAYLPREGVSASLLIGVDTFGQSVGSKSYNNSEQADFLALVVFDSKKEKFTVIHINRDTVADFDVLGVFGQKVGTKTGQLALAHTYGDGLEVSCRNTVNAVSNFLYGVKIDNYLSITMDVVPILNDHLGGVSLTFDKDYTEIDSRFSKGKTVLFDGNSALSFVRERSSLTDSTNISRMARQQLYIKSFIVKAQNTKTDSDFWLSAYDKISDYTVTDFNLNNFSRLMDKLKSYDLSGIVSLKGESVKGEEFMEFYADEEALKATVVELFYEKSK